MIIKRDDKAVLTRVLDQWQAAVDAHQPEGVAALFAEEAVFQGLRPYSVGRQSVADYYDSQPLGMTAAYGPSRTIRSPA
ncbi:hypothetical protein [Streptomyces adustus]